MKRNKDTGPSPFFNLVKLFAFIFAGVAAFCSLMMDLNRPNTVPGGRSSLMVAVQTVLPESEKEDEPSELFGSGSVTVNGGDLYAKVKALYQAGVIPAELPRTFNRTLKSVPAVSREMVLYHFIQACAERGYTSATLEIPEKSELSQPQLFYDTLRKSARSLYHVSDFSLSATYSLKTENGYRMQIHWINSDFARMSEAVQSMLRVARQELQHQPVQAWESQWLHLNVEEIKALDTALNLLAEHVRKEDTPLQRARLLHDALIRMVEYHDLKDAKSVCYQNRNKFVIYAMQGNAICEGYAQAYGFLLHLAGVQSQVVCGLVNKADGSASGHAWNLVKGPQGWRHVDVTWDDDGNRSRDMFFMASDETMQSRQAGARTWRDQTYVPATK